MICPSHPAASSRFARYPVVCLLLCLLIGFGNAASAQSNVPSNIDNNLRRVVTGADQKRTATASAAAQSRAARRPPSAIRDKEGRVLVIIHLNGKVSPADLRQLLSSAGANVTGENNWYLAGAISAYVPVGKIAEIARAGG